MKQLTKQEAIRIGESGLWKDWTLRERAEFQMVQEYLCMPFSAFHEAIEATLGRPVFTHEFGLNWNEIKAELFNGAPAPSLEEIINLIPEEKRVLVFTTDEQIVEK